MSREKEIELCACSFRHDVWIVNVYNYNSERWTWRHPTRGVLGPARTQRHATSIAYCPFWKSMCCSQGCFTSLSYPPRSWLLLRDPVWACDDRWRSTWKHTMWLGMFMRNPTQSMLIGEWGDRFLYRVHKWWPDLALDKSVFCDRLGYSSFNDWYWSWGRS